MHVMASTACRSLGLLCLREQLICLCLGPVCVAQSLTVGGWSAGYRVACTVSASYGQGLGEAGQIRGADRGTSAVPGRLSRGSVGPSDLNLYDFILGRLSRIAVGPSDLNLSRDPRDRANQILSRVPGTKLMSRDW